MATAVSRIPEGTVATYGQIAALAGNPRGAREVVRVLRSVAGLPWHRVVGKGGRISLPGEGGKAQRLKLEEEGVEFNPDGTVHMDRHQLRPG
ncbi:MAG: MGMT family protein [candidate division WOR-3 bacterium]